jgi:GNAT superfamily N-acetyltransferase
MELRNITDSDLDEVMRVQWSVYRPELQEPRQAFARKLELFPRGALGCYDGGRLIGYLFCIPWVLGSPVPFGDETTALPRSPECLYIHDLGVVPERRGKGVGRALACRALKLGRSLGFKAYALTAVQGSEAFWQRWGFTELGRMEYCAGIPAVYMVKK